MSPEREHHDECYACPIGGFFLTARGSNPEAFDHLVNAAAELVAAARSVLEVAEHVIDQQRSSRTPGPSRVQRIDLAEERDQRPDTASPPGA